MKLLDKPLDYEERKQLMMLIDGNIVRVCVSDDIEEIMSSLGFAIDRLSMIAYSRVKALSNAKDNDK